MTSGKYFGMANGKRNGVKFLTPVQTELLVEHVWDTFDLAALEVILGAIGALVIFRQHDSQNSASSTPRMTLFQPKLFKGVHYESPHKTLISWNLEL